MEWYEHVRVWLNPDKNPDLEAIFQRQAQMLPTLWLLGKTGAGKSSLIHALTGDAKIAIGNGFQPCTQTAQAYDYPSATPLLRFLDTRGLAEADYDARADIAACQDRSHALLVVLKADDPEQSAVLNGLRQIKAFGTIQHLLVVHTGIFLLANLVQRQQAISHNQQQVEAVMGTTLTSVSVDFASEDLQTSGVTDLQQLLVQMLPILAHVKRSQFHTDQEANSFACLEKQVLWYAGAAAASDVLPAAGLAAVLAVQGKMLHSLANQYGIEWNNQLLTEFMAALGTGFWAQYLSRLGIRELVKLIPAYGQTVGTAAAVALSFASTYGVGRIACKYFYHKSKGETVSTADLQAVYETALNRMAKESKP